MPYKTDREFLVRAYEVATKSPDPSTQNGAVIPFYHLGIPDSIEACNTFPDGVLETPERLQRPLKYNFIEHAERGAVIAAAKRGVPLRGFTMYVPWFACSDCARAIIGSGIVKVVGHKRMLDATPDHWKESIAHAVTMLKEAGIETVLLEEHLPEAPVIRFNGQLWQP